MIKDFIKAKNSKGFATLAHIQRYEWCLPFIRGVVLDAGCRVVMEPFPLLKIAK